MVVTPTEIAGVTPMSEPGLPQNGEQGEETPPVSYPKPKSPIRVTFAEGMLRGDVDGFYYRTFIGDDPKEAAWNMLVTCFKRLEHYAAINALTPTRNSASIAPNSKIDELRPEPPASGAAVSGPWMPGDWDRR